MTPCSTVAGRQILVPGPLWSPDISITSAKSLAPAPNTCPCLVLVCAKKSCDSWCLSGLVVLSFEGEKFQKQPEIAHINWTCYCPAKLSYTQIMKKKMHTNHILQFVSSFYFLIPLFLKNYIFQTRAKLNIYLFYLFITNYICKFASI